MSTTEITHQRVDPMEMIQRAFESAISNGAGMEVVDRILAQQREMIDYNDRLRFHDALRRIQDKLKTIPKRGWNPDTKSHYALAQDVDAGINSLLQEEGMVLSFEPRPSDKAEEVFIVGTLSLGAYSKEYPLPMPADGKGAKGGGVMSRTHATGSAITYGKRYLKDMIFNLSFRERDDDGNAAGGSREVMPDTAVEEWIDALREAPDIDSLKSVFADCWGRAKKLQDAQAKEAFRKVYEAQKRSFL
jgi:ERF superfamily